MNYPFEKEQAGALATASFFLVVTTQTGATQTTIWASTIIALGAMTYCVLFPLFKSMPLIHEKLAQFAETQTTFGRSVSTSLGIGVIGGVVLTFFTFLVSLATAFGAFVIIDVAGGELEKGVDQFVQLTFLLWRILVISSVVCGVPEVIAQGLKHDPNNKPVAWVFLHRYLKQPNQPRLFISISVGSAVMGLIYAGDIALRFLA
ncbi:hypothetical protein GG681_06780 [Epibacterium sp. SM1969]|uniref:Uncharacterized protein n=1 Tax=Tritonibacter aquimaris TaxID=2663379 RepID=A0A844AWH9_9RHOB|nr:hypothetical protein [Tritonibacter aquimaris]MQY42341.1 hypothetical protein [Tritonibacter aquimaris]